MQLRKTWSPHEETVDLWFSIVAVVQLCPHIHCYITHPCYFLNSFLIDRKGFKGGDGCTTTIMLGHRFHQILQLASEQSQWNFLKDTRYQWSPKWFLVCRTKCPADIKCSTGHFDYLLNFLLPDVQQIGSFLPDILCWTFPPHWPLLDKMSGSAWTLCWTFQNCAGHVWHIWRSLISYAWCPKHIVPIAFDISIKENFPQIFIWLSAAFAHFTLPRIISTVLCYWYCSVRRLGCCSCTMTCIRRDEVSSDMHANRYAVKQGNKS